MEGFLAHYFRKCVGFFFFVCLFNLFPAQENANRKIFYGGSANRRIQMAKMLETVCLVLESRSLLLFLEKQSQRRLICLGIRAGIVFHTFIH